MADTPHDALFRFAFTQPGVAADHFRASLPAEVAEAARWETLQLLPGSFVDEDLKQVHSDVLHRVTLRGGAELPPEGQRLIMGYGEQLIEQGRQEGLLLGKAQVLLKQMRLKFGPVPDAVVARVEAASEAELERWTERILVGETLAAVLG